MEPVLIDLPTSIATERLHLRPPQAGDGPVLFSAIADSLPELRRFLASLPWLAIEQSAAASEVYCRNSQANFLARKDLPFLAFEKATGDLVGAVGLHRIEWTTPKAEVGYWGRTTRRGNGFITEAVRAVTSYGFEHLGAMRLELVTDEENFESRKVAERCGFQLEGVLRSERRAPDGALRNTCIYALFPVFPLAPSAASDSGTPRSGP
jgi:RimJ/RimL family protein N-acetyltransferase